MAKKPKLPKQVEALRHEEASRRNIPTAEYQSMLVREGEAPVEVRYERRGTGLEAEKDARNRDLDPQLVWRGKDEKDWSDLVVPAPPLFIQEKVHPKVLIDDLMRRSQKAASEQPGAQVDLFADFNGIADPSLKTEFYQHDANWTNRMILGDSLQVMASLAEREGLRGQVQCIYIDPPYGIKFNSNFQWSTTSRDVKDGDATHITREPEQVKAFRDTWRDGIHSYLTYLRDRLTVARDLLTESGSVFVQIGDENVHRIRALMDDLLGAENFVSLVTFRKKEMSLGAKYLDSVSDYLVWYAKCRQAMRYRPLYLNKDVEGDSHWDRVALQDGSRRKLSPEERRDHRLLPSRSRLYRLHGMTPARGVNRSGLFTVRITGRDYPPPKGASWSTTELGMKRLLAADRVEPYATGDTLSYVIFLDDYPVMPVTNLWDDLSSPSNPMYVVQTNAKAVTRCVLMTSDPGDLVLDPTCGSGTTAVVAEQWGRRWITIDSSRVALALARARIMGSRHPFYLLADSLEGQIKEAEISRSVPSGRIAHGQIRQGFVNTRAPHITLGSIANDAEIDVVWEKYLPSMESLLRSLNEVLGKSWEEWEVPREAEAKWPAKAKELHAKWWEQRISRQREIDASIAAKAEYEYLYDKPYEDPKKVRVAGPFTVESLSPHRVLGVDENDELIDLAEKKLGYGEKKDFPTMILENLKVAGVQQAHKEDKISFASLVPWPGRFICAEGKYREGANGAGVERRAGVFIGPEFGTVSRPDLVEAARECADAGFDVLIACAFNYDVHTTEFSNLGRIPVLKARMNADLHMAEDLKSTGKGNLFVIFGEPDVRIHTGGSAELLAEVANRERTVEEYANKEKELEDATEPEEKERIAAQIRKRERFKRFIPFAKGVADGLVFVEVWGVDVFRPQTGQISSNEADEIACWFLDTDYNEESFFVRHAYFLGANDPYKALKTTLKAEIDEEAWASLHSDTSRPFDKPTSGRIAVKVINHLGDEVMKVFRA